MSAQISHPPPPRQHSSQAWLGKVPRQWQVQALPLVEAALRQNTRGVVRATTGAGKSILQAELIARWLEEGLEAHRRIVVTAPTQKLVEQLGDTLGARLGAHMVGGYYQHSKHLDRPIIIACHSSLYGQPQVVCPHCHPDAAAHPQARELEGEALKLARELFETSAVQGSTALCEGVWEGHDQAISVPSRLTLALLEAGLDVALWVADECHKTEAPSVKAFAEWIRPQQLVGFTATPWRSNAREELTLFDELLFDYGPTQAIADRVVLMPTIVPYGGECESLDEACLDMIRDHLRRHHGPGVVSADDIEDAEAFALYLQAHQIKAEPIHSRLDVELQQERIALLGEGALEVLVHVNMLAEGVDLPWLEWLCLRRANATRVRFCQEVGRVIRCAQGKAHCWVLDPHDLFGRLALDYEAVLGGESEEDEVCSELDQLAKEVASFFSEEREPGSPTERKARRAQCLDAVRAWLRRTALELRMMGWSKLKSTSTSWRSHAPSNNQIALIEEVLRHKALITAAGTMTEAQRVTMREASKAALRGQLSRGDTADFLDILFVLRKQRQLPTEVRHAS